MALITDIAAHINKTDEDLNLIIQDFLSGNYYFGESTTVTQWRIANYEILRKWAYPLTTEYLDAQVKIGSGNSVLIEEGQLQLAQYLTSCLAVKERFPKS